MILVGIEEEKERHEEIRKRFIAWKMAEGWDKGSAIGFFNWHYSHGERQSQAEIVKVETFQNEGYSEFHKANNLADSLIIDQYMRMTENHDFTDEKVRRGFLTQTNNTNFSERLRPNYNILLDSIQLALDGAYISAFILLRTATEGIIKAGLITKIRNDESDKLYNELDSDTIGLEFDDKWGTSLEIIESNGEKKSVIIDELGMAQLSNYAGKLGVTSPVKNVYKKFNLWEFNNYTHINKPVIEASWISPLYHRKFLPESWNDFATMYLSAKEILLLIAHYYAKSLEWFNPKELDLNEIRDICKHFPSYAEALIPDGLIKNCIDCGKKLTTKKLLEHHGRCYTCHSK